MHLSVVDRTCRSAFTSKGICMHTAAEPLETRLSHFLYSQSMQHNDGHGAINLGPISTASLAAAAAPGCLEHLAAMPVPMMCQSLTPVSRNTCPSPFRNPHVSLLSISSNVQIPTEKRGVAAWRLMLIPYSSSVLCQNPHTLVGRRKAAWGVSRTPTSPSLLCNTKELSNSIA